MSATCTSYILLPLLLILLILPLVWCQPCKAGMIPEDVNYEFYPRRIQKDLHINCKVTVLSTCTITSVKWMFERKTISSSDPRYKISAPQDAKLTIVNPNKRYVGRYVAEITANDGNGVSDEVKCFARVFGSPLVLYNEDYATDELSRHFREGETVDIGRQFEILGYPLDVQWLKDGKPLANDDRIEYGVNDKKLQTKLKIRSVTKKDAGEYKVIAKGSPRGADSSKSRTFRIVNDIDFFMPLILIAAEIVIFMLLFICNQCLHQRRMRKREEKRLKGLMSQSAMDVAASEAKAQSVAPQSEMRAESLAVSEHMSIAQSVKSAETRDYSVMSARPSTVRPSTVKPLDG